MSRIVEDILGTSEWLKATSGDNNLRDFDADDFPDKIQAYPWLGPAEEASD